MSIEVRIPKEITEYKEKIMFGLSLRQLVCFSSAMVLCIGTYFGLTMGLNLNSDLVGYIVIFEAMPLLAYGFIQKNGFTFEKYAAMLIRHKTGILKRPYKTKLLIDLIKDKNEKKVGKYDWIFQKENTGTTEKISRKERKADTQKRECEVFAVTKAGRKKQSEITKRKIKTARKEYRTEKQRIIESGEKRSRPKDSAGNNKI